MQDCLHAAKISMPTDALDKFIRRCFSLTREELEVFIRSPDFKCWNIHGVRRFCVDVSTILQARPLKPLLTG